MKVARRGSMRVASLRYLSVLGLSACSHALPTAQIEDAQGSVLAGRTQDALQPVVKAAQVRAGGLLMTMADGRAVIAYNDGCKVKVEPNSLVTIAQESPCKSVERPVGLLHSR